MLQNLEYTDCVGVVSKEEKDMECINCVDASIIADNTFQKNRKAKPGFNERSESTGFQGMGF